MNDSDNEVKYVNKDAVYNKDGERKSFSELKTIFKGSIGGVITYIVTNKVSLFLAGKAQDDFIFWLGQESVRHPELAGIIRVGKEVISVAWNLLVANPVLCASVMAAFVAFGVIAVSAIKKARLKRKKMKGQVKTNEVKAVEEEEKDNSTLVK